MDLKRVEKSNLIAEARRLERNQAYLLAVHSWEIARDLDPNDLQIDREIQHLQALQGRGQLINDRIQRLTTRMKEIRPIYTQVVRRMKKMLDEGGEDVTVLSLVDNFLTNQLSATDLMATWEALAGEPMSAPMPIINFRALADRMKRGEIVFFLGSDIPRLFDTAVLDVMTIVARLAGQASYDDFTGSLSMIAEYYQMKPEYGRASLVRNLYALLPDVSLRVPLYDLLASITQPLILISSAYDTLLETAFHRTGKQYALITSLIGAEFDSDVGHILLQYPGQEPPASPCLEEKLSHLNLLDNGFSLIYKIRGYLEPHTDQSIYQQNSLTLSEDNYFNFARYVNKLVPSYIVRQFTGRGFWFLGYTPTHWEDRLIANTILYRRRAQNEPAYAVSNDTNRFEEMYWERHGVRRYALSLKEFVERLEENFS